MGLGWLPAVEVPGDLLPLIAITPMPLKYNPFFSLGPAGLVDVRVQVVVPSE